MQNNLHKLKPKESAWKQFELCGRDCVCLNAQTADAEWVLVHAKKEAGTGASRLILKTTK